MSKYETPLTEGFWQSACRGAFIPEYKLVRRSRDQGVRLVDALILPDEQHGRFTYADYPDLAGQHVVVAQTKASRMGMYIMGQALFSARLVHGLGATPVRSVILVTKTDAALEPLLEPYPEVEVWVTSADRPDQPKRVA